MSSNSDPSGALALGVIVGLWTFIKGFRVYREYKVVEDTPEIHIRSVPMGLVRVRGKAALDQPILSPLSKTPCCFYKVEIEHWKTEKGSGSWSHLRTDTDGAKFYLCDDTGKLVVDAQRAELDLPQTAQRVVDSQKPSSGMPGATDSELLEYVNYSGVHKFASFIEHRLENKGPVDDPKREQARQTLLAMVQSVPNVAHGGSVKLDLVEKMMSLAPLKDAADGEKRQQAFAHIQTLAQSGELHIPNFGVGAASGRYRLKEYLVVPGQEYNLTGTCTENPEAHGPDDRNMICKGQHESTFLISSKTEVETEKSLRKSAFLKVFGGAALALICLTLLLIHLKLF
ncbi:MAG TPA: hypothetical protein VFI95_06595 [Terriglobales bacterium]|nr:hypothetical protein [Terriglobales bacterium]